jgi:hypothetical protein
MSLLKLPKAIGIGAFDQGRRAKAIVAVNPWQPGGVRGYRQ